MKQNYFLKLAFFILLSLISSFNLKAQLNTGDIALIAYNADGGDDFAFVALVDIPANESIYFTDNEWNGSAFNDLNEGELTWTYTSILSAGSVVVLSDVATSPSANVGSISGSGFNLGASNEWFYALTSFPATSYVSNPTFLAAFANDAGSGWLTSTGLTEGTTAVDFNDDNDGYQYTGARTGETSLADYRTLIYNTSNWSIETSNGENILPINTTSFSAGVAVTPGITVGSVSGNTNESGTQVTFTVVLNAAPTSDVVLDVTSDDTGEVTLDLSALTFTNANWDTPQTVTATGQDDGIQDGSIDVTITVAVNDGSSDDVYDGISASTTITNDDNELPNLVINEFQADPDASSGDANGDGSVNTSQDEFIEIYNASGGVLDISDYTINDSVGLRHTFPKGTIIPAGAVIVVFGGGTPTNIPCLTQVASVGYLGLNNGGDTIIIKDDSSTTITSYTYGSEGGDNQSVARGTDLTGSFVKHSTIGGNSVLFSPGRGNADNIPFSKSWTGSSDNDWTNASNWDTNSTPSSVSDNVWISSGLSNYPTATSAVSVNSVIMESGSSLIAQSTFTGSVTYNRNISTTNWYLVSSPVVGQDIDAFVTTEGLASGTNGSNLGLSDYNNATPGWTYYQNGASGTGSFTSGDGRSIKLASQGDISFTGTINTSDVTVAMTSNSNGFNLVGNPYPSYIAGNENADGSNNILTINSANLTENTLWFWNQSTGSYNQINQASTAFQIAPAQGFFVSATGSVNLSITEAMQSHQGTDSFQRLTTRPEIVLTLSNGTAIRNADIYYIEGTTTGWNNGYDSSIFGGVANEFAIYTHAVANGNGRNLGIQSLPPNNYENMIIPVGINAEAGTVITIDATTNNFPEGINIYLEDKQDNSFTLLEADANFSFTPENNLDGIGRFYLHTTSGVLSADDFATNTNINIYTSGNDNLRIVGVQNGTATVRLYNILGKEVLNTSFIGSGVNDINLNAFPVGIYIVKLTTENGTLNRKIIIQ